MAGEVNEPWQDLGTELLVDEPGVKAWIERVPAHSSRPAHTHRHPWVTVVLSGAAGESRTPDGELIESGSVQTGAVRFHGLDCLPFSHYLNNTSDDTMVMVAVEFRSADFTDFEGFESVENIENTVRQAAAAGEASR